MSEQQLEREGPQGGGVHTWAQGAEHAVGVPVVQDDGGVQQALFMLLDIATSWPSHCPEPESTWPSAACERHATIAARCSMAALMVVVAAGRGGGHTGWLAVQGWNGPVPAVLHKTQ